MNDIQIDVFISHHMIIVLGYNLIYFLIYFIKSLKHNFICINWT